MNVVGRTIGEQALDRSFEVATVGEVGVDHVAGGVEGAQRQHPAPQAFRRLVHADMFSASTTSASVIVLAAFHPTRRRLKTSITKAT